MRYRAYSSMRGEGEGLSWGERQSAVKMTVRQSETVGQLGTAELSEQTELR